MGRKSPIPIHTVIRIKKKNPTSITSEWLFTNSKHLEKEVVNNIDFLLSLLFDWIGKLTQ